MLSFFSSPYYYAPAQTRQPSASAEPVLNTLFRLLDDFDTCHSSALGAPAHQRHHPYYHHRHVQRQQMQAFTPRFDVRETESAYHLHGELPGIDRNNLEIQFTDPQTIVVRGRVERTYDSENSSSAAPEETQEAQQTTTEAAPQHQTEEQMTTEADETASVHSASSGSSSSSHGWHHATVEDDPEERATPTSESEIVTVQPASTTSEITKPSDAVTSTEKPAPAAETEKQQKPASRLWVYERSVGESSRTFTFPSRVDADAVTASLENGVLNVTVPKAMPHQARRIAIF